MTWFYFNANLRCQQSCDSTLRRTLTYSENFLTIFFSAKANSRCQPSHDSMLFGVRKERNFKRPGYDSTMRNFKTICLNRSLTEHFFRIKSDFRNPKFNALPIRTDPKSKIRKISIRNRSEFK